MIGARPGFTLLEMLVSVAIFSGLVVLILAVFVRTASSQARVNVLREKSEVARSTMARLTNDFQYLYKEKPVTLGDPVDLNKTFSGFYLIDGSGFDDVGMVLKYPNKTDSQLVFKRYRTQNTGGTTASRSRTIDVREFRDCRFDPVDGKMYLTRCGGYAQSPVYSKVLPDGYLLDDRPIFTGLEPNPASQRTGFLKIALTIKSADFESVFCASSAVPKGTCYKVETVLTAGGVN